MKNIMICLTFLFCLNAGFLYAKAIDVEKFAEEYMQSPIEADRKYLKKKVDLIGSVNKVGRTILFKPYLEIIAYKDDYDEYYVYAYPHSRYYERIQKLKKGDTVRVIGVCDGKSFSGNITIVNCKIYTKKK